MKTMRIDVMSTTRRTAFAVTIAVSLLLTAQHASAAEKADVKCLKAVSKAIQTFTLKKLQALSKCRETPADPSTAQCPDDKAQSAIAKAYTKKVNTISGKCRDFDPSRALAYTGCPDIPGCTGSDVDPSATAAGYIDCADCASTVAPDRLARTTSDGACGNGHVDSGEECDDGNRTGGDGCSAVCEIEPVCGNEQVETPEEQCDPPGSSDDCAEGEVCNSTCQCGPPCDCCGATYLKSTVAVGSGICGHLRNFRCSNAPISVCADDSDCPGGTCVEQTTGGLPLDLECGGLYTGGGLNSVPLPLAIPDTSSFLLKITSCNSATGNLELGRVTQAEAVAAGFDPGRLSCSEGRKCSGGANDGLQCVLASDCPGGTCEDLCLFGAPLPIPNGNTAPTSTCAVNVAGGDASGTGTCNGESVVSVPLRSVIYLNGDLFKEDSPPNIPGIQPCPLCDTLCQGGSQSLFPCDADSDCPGGTCGTSPECLGGLDDGQPCTPGTSSSEVLSDSQNAFPTSHDCRNDPGQDITANIGGLPVNFAMTTGTLTSTMPKRAVDRPAGRRNFCGFCRDFDVVGTLCFEGDTDASCPEATPAADGNAVPCSSDADCDDGDAYASCVQRNPGAFSKAAATSIDMEGEGAGCLADGTSKPATTVGTFCIPPTFDPTVDAAGDLPGPGAVSLQIQAQLLQ